MNNDIALIKVENYKFSEILSSFYTDDHWYKYHSTCFISVSGSDVEQAFLVGSVSSLTASGFTAYGEYGSGIGASIASSIPGQVTFSALAGGLTAVACEGDFIEGAAQGTLTYLANHLAHRLESGGGDPPQKGKVTGRGNDFDVDKAVNWLDENAKLTSIGKCAQYVRLALEAGGINTSPHPVPARLYGPYLEEWGFNVASSTNYKPIKGDIAVFDWFKGHSNGHIQMYNGSQWISDFRQNGFWPGSAYRNNNTDYVIFRWK